MHKFEAKPDSIVEEYKIGNTTLKVSNSAYINRTPEEIQESLKRIVAIGLRYFRSQSINRSETEIEVK